MISLLQLDVPLIIFICGVMAFSGLVHGTLGLGFPMVATPIIAIFLDVRLAILLTLLPTAAVNLATIFSGSGFKRTLSRYFVLILFSLVGGIAGSYLLTIMDPDPFRLVLAALILVFLASSHLGKIPRELLEKYRWVAMLSFGLLAGLSAGTTNVMVAILLIYFLSLELPRNEMVPLLNSCFLVGKVAQIIVFAGAGLVTVTSMIEAIPLAGIALIALFFGQRLQNKISVDFYRRILQFLLVVLAITLLVQYFN